MKTLSWQNSNEVLRLLESIYLFNKKGTVPGFSKSSMIEVE